MMLYKYLQPDRIQDVFHRRTLRFTPPVHLNDPFEALPYISALAPDRVGLVHAAARTIAALSSEERLRLPEPLHDADERRVEEWLLEHPKAFDGLMAQWNPSGELLNELVNCVYETANRIGILSLSALPDNLLMWSHYADDHRGFVVEFDSSDHFFQRYVDRAEILDICRQPQPVQYVRKRPQVDLESMTETDIFLTKFDDWAYEQEWRFGRGLADADSHSGDVHLFRFPASCLSGVILGCDMPSERMGEVISLVKGNSEFRHVRLRKAMRSPGRYGVIVVELLFDAQDIDNR